MVCVLFRIDIVPKCAYRNDLKEKDVPDGTPKYYAIMNISGYRGNSYFAIILSEMLAACICLERVHYVIANVTTIFLRYYAQCSHLRQDETIVGMFYG